MDDTKNNGSPKDTLGGSPEDGATLTLEQEAAKLAEEDKIAWFGFDGALVALFAALVIVMFCSLWFKIDVLSGYVFPILLLVIVCVVTVSYLRTLGKFIRDQYTGAKVKEAREAGEDPDTGGGGI